MVLITVGTTNDTTATPMVAAVSTAILTQNILIKKMAETSDMPIIMDMAYAFALRVMPWSRS